MQLAPMTSREDECDMTTSGHNDALKKGTEISLTPKVNYSIKAPYGVDGNTL